MQHTAALVSSLASLGLIAAIYYCNILSRPGSWFRGDMLAMILLSLLTGIFPLAAGTSLIGLWQATHGGFSLAALGAAGVDLVSLGLVVASVALFAALVRATYRGHTAPTSITPLSPRPVNRGPEARGGSARRAMKKAA